jgi:hypothetical protein
MSVQYHKVTPIYQCIDSGNWKGAVKLCQRKDVEQWDITRALLAYCLNQLDRAEQALETALAVKVPHSLTRSLTFSINHSLTHAHNHARNHSQ